jgi:XTP/dITP diphosphohydrolase
MRIAHRLVLASLNPDKFFEFQEIFKAYPDVELVRADSALRNPEKLGFVEVHSTYLENAMAKARLANHGCHYPTLGDDSGLEVDALGGAPGVRSFRYAKLPSQEKSREAQDHANRELLIAELSKKNGYSRDARFVTTLALCVEGVLIHATGTLEGSINDQPRGTNGFGYDSLFIPRGHTRTLAEMSDQEKNALSHRAQAVHALMAHLRARNLLLAKP